MHIWLWLLLLVRLSPWSLCSIFFFVITVVKVYSVWYKHWHPGFILSYFHGICFSIPSLDVSLDMKWVSYRQYIYGSCFHIYSAILCLLIGAVTPHTFKVIVYFLVIQLLTPCFQCKGHRFRHWSGNYLGWNPAYHVAQLQKNRLKKILFIVIYLLLCC